MRIVSDPFFPEANADGVLTRPDLLDLGDISRGDHTFYPISSQDFDSLSNPAGPMPMKWIRRVRRYLCTINATMGGVGTFTLEVPMKVEGETNEGGSICYLKDFTGTLHYDIGDPLHFVDASATISFGADADLPGQPTVGYVAGEGPYWPRMKLIFGAAITGSIHQGISYPDAAFDSLPGIYVVSDASFDGVPIKLKVHTADGGEVHSVHFTVTRYWQFGTDDGGENAIVDETTGELLQSPFQSAQ